MLGAYRLDKTIKMLMSSKMEKQFLVLIFPMETYETSSVMANSWLS